MSKTFKPNFATGFLEQIPGMEKPGIADLKFWTHNGTKPNFELLRVANEEYSEHLNSLSRIRMADPSDWVDREYPEGEIEIKTEIDEKTGPFKLAYPINSETIEDKQRKFEERRIKKYESAYPKTVEKEETVCIFCDQVCEPSPTNRGWASAGKYKRGLHFDCAKKVASLEQPPSEVPNKFLSILEENYRVAKYQGDNSEWDGYTQQQAVVETYEDMIALYKQNRQSPSKEGEAQQSVKAVELLKELCQLKHYKDTVGKDSFYEKRQPELWKEANNFLNSLAKNKQL